MNGNQLIQLCIGGGILTGLAGVFFMAGKLVNTVEQLVASISKVENRMEKVEDRLGDVEKEVKDVQTKVTVLWEQRTGA